MDHQFIRAYAERAVTDNPNIMRFVASTEGVGRDGLIIDADAWDLTNFEKSPLVLWAHDYQGNRPPIGRAVKVWTEKRRLLADIEWDLADPFAADVARKYTSGFLNAVSVGWDTKEVEPGDGNGKPPRVKRAELLDISAVPVPGDPKALMERQKRGLALLAADLNTFLADDTEDEAEPEEKRAAIPPHSSPKADEGTAWDAGAAVKAVEAIAGPLRRMHAWVNSEADQDAKGSYKLPHHTADGQVVWRGVAAAMARLLQAGTQIPDADRRGVYNHLSRHYGQFDKTPPEFRTVDELDAYAPAEIRGLFLEGEPDLFPDLFMEMEQRGGKVLSKRSVDLIDTAIAALQELKRTAGTKEDQDEEEERTARILRDMIYGASNHERH